MYLYNVEIADRCSMMLSKTRANANISRRAMSEAISISESTIKTWESGQGSPTLSTLLNWFHVVGENPFSYMLEFFWPNTFANLRPDSTDSELRHCLNVYLEEVAGPYEIRQLHHLILGEYGGSWSGVLDMFCAHTHTSLNNRYKIADIIQTSYEMSVANNQASPSTLITLNKQLLREAISAARDATLSHKSGYTMYDFRDNYRNASSNIIKKARSDSDVKLSYIAKAMGKTERTIRNWEENTEPSFLDLCAFFRIIGRPMWTYLRSEMIPGEDISSTSETTSEKTELIRYFSLSDRTEIRKLCYLIFWKHGSNWHSLLELMIEHISSPLSQRVISARSVLVGYEIDSNDRQFYEPIGILPDVENLKLCIEKGTRAAKAGKNSY